jgi:hypothetical protein
LTSCWVPKGLSCMAKGETRTESLFTELVQGGGMLVGVGWEKEFS